MGFKKVMGFDKVMGFKKFLLHLGNYPLIPRTIVNKLSSANKYRHMKPWSGKAECARRRNRAW